MTTTTTTKKKRPSARAKTRSVGTVVSPVGPAGPPKLRVIAGGKGRGVDKREIGAWLRLAAASELGLDFAIPGLVLP
jgi:hypothetical protein